ncbi:Translocon-associated protein beta (TRAPB) [uncultured archaeon]|nr:Translocon-associated protein beta (TRAPB) [uncultured archaeon]
MRENLVHASLIILFIAGLTSVSCATEESIPWDYAPVPIGDKQVYIGDSLNDWGFDPGRPVGIEYTYVFDLESTPKNAFLVIELFEVSIRDDIKINGENAGYLCLSQKSLNWEGCVIPLKPGAVTAGKNRLTIKAGLENNYDDFLMRNVRLMVPPLFVRPDIAVVRSVYNITQIIGIPFNMEVSIANFGGQHAFGVQLKQDIPDVFQVLDGNPNYTNRSLNAGGIVTYAVRLNATKLGAFEFQPLSYSFYDEKGKAYSNVTPTLTVFVHPERPVLKVKRDGPSEGFVGGLGNVSITVSNVGNGTAYDVFIRDFPLLDSFDVVGGQANYTLPTLMPMESFVLFYTYSPKEVVDIFSRAEVYYGDGVGSNYSVVSDDTHLVVSERPASGLPFDLGSFDVRIFAVAVSVMLVVAAFLYFLREKVAS